MEYLIVIGICIFTIIMLAIILNINFKTIKQIKEIGFDKNLNELTNQLPENKMICEEILKIVKNQNVKVKEEQSKQASLYLINTNTIVIANIKNTFTRVQTIAHECIHSTQDKVILWFNFIFSNVYMLYFIIITICALLNKLENQIIYLFILINLGGIYYFVRSYLEMDAMTKAYYLAGKYLKNKTDQISGKDINTILDKYKELNNIGVKATIFFLLISVIVKIIIFCLANII